MTPAGTTRVTSEICPRCEGEASVGWRAVVPANASWPVVEYAVEFDCAAGCGLTVEEMVWSFNPSVSAQTAPSPGEEEEPDRPDDVPAASLPEVDVPARRLEALELIPGHPNTQAEVWLWHGRVPEVSDDARLWISLKTDDWPMCPSTARGLASALLAAAAVAEA